MDGSVRPNMAHRTIFRQAPLHARRSRASIWTFQRLILTGLAFRVRPVFLFISTVINRAFTMIRIYLQRINTYQSSSKQSGINACDFGRLDTDRGWLALNIGRLSAVILPASKNQDHDPSHTPATRVALSPPIGILPMDAP